MVLIDSAEVFGNDIVVHQPVDKRTSLTTVQLDLLALAYLRSLAARHETLGAGVADDVCGAVVDGMKEVEGYGTLLGLIALGELRTDVLRAFSKVDDPQ